MYVALHEQTHLHATLRATETNGSLLPHGL